MNNASDPSGKRNPTGRNPDSDPWKSDEADKEIAGLRNALDEHLRSLDTPKPPLDTSQHTPIPTGNSYSSRDRLSSTSVSGEGKRSGFVAFAAISGLVLGISISISLVSLERANIPVTTSQSPLQSPDSLLTSPQPKQVSPTPSRESTAPASTRGEADRKESGTNVNSDGGASAQLIAAVRWQACLDQERRDAEPPRPGETWWPVVGPKNSLDDARRHCRDDAFINRSGNAQISSFRDHETATAFAEQLTRDSSHPWRFWVGDPSVR